MATRATRAEPHTYRSWEFLHVLAEPYGNPCISFLMVILAGGMVCGCVSPTMTTVSHKHGDLSLAGMISIKVHISL